MLSAYNLYISDHFADEHPFLTDERPGTAF